MRHLIWPAVMFAIVPFIHTAEAQSSNRLGPGPSLTRRVPELPPVASGISWPRLDAGAIFCRTQEDLRRRGELMAKRGSGAVTPPGPAPDCRVITATVAVDVVDRPLPSATQVRLKSKTALGVADNQGGETGWTDTWLPDKAPR